MLSDALREPRSNHGAQGGYDVTKWQAGGLIGALMLLSSLQTLAQERSLARSMVISQHGIVAAEYPLAARAGTAILETGGNAIDAAIAANAAMGLTAPMMAGLARLRPIGSGCGG
jgi:gamma-glutamyltranspeptidase